MALAAGYKAYVAVGVETEYGTIVEPTELLPAISADITMNAIKAESNMVVGEAFNEDNRDTVKYETSGALTCIGDYQALDILIGAALGGTITKTGSSVPYTHENVLSTADNERHFTIGIVKDVEDDYIHSAKINEMIVTSNPDGVIFTFNVVANKRTRATTHNTAIKALAFTLGRRIFHDHLVFRIADCANALAAGDAISISEFEMTLNNNFQTDCYDTSSTSKTYPAEPFRNGKGTVMLKFTVPRYTANTLVAALESETKLQADAIWTGPTLGEGNYTMTMEFPTVKVISASYPQTDDALIPLEVECQCFNNNANTNMNTIAEPVEITMQNSRATAAWT